MANPTLASAALAAVPRERSGMASGAVNTARQFGLAVGIAVLGTVFTAGATSALRDAGTPDPAGTASALSAGQAPRLLDAADPAARSGLTDALKAGFADGLREVFLACGLAGIVGGLLVLWLVRATAPADSAERASQESAPEPAAR
jgi:hypothetical protein